MSRAITYLVILILLAVLVIAPRQDDGGTGGEPAPAGPYQAATLAAFEKVLATPDWSPAGPPRNAQGMMESIHEKTGLTFVLIPGGSFQMGSPEDEKGGEPWEGPVHTVAVSPFLLCKTECTQRAWEKGGGKNESAFKGADRPVEQVSEADCHDWRTRNGLRLPSEAEWEYACRAGTQTRFSFGDRDSDLAKYGWYFVNSGKRVLPTNTEWDRRGYFGEWGCATHPVSQKLPNAWGLFDMHGNVWEVCEDLWYGSYDGAPIDGRVWTSRGLPTCVFRGGDFGSIARICRSACRNDLMAYRRYPLTGIRFAADLPE